MEIASLIFDEKRTSQSLKVILHFYESQIDDVIGVSL